jgi:hypothetical protein
MFAARIQAYVHEAFGVWIIPSKDGLKADILSWFLED